MGAFTLVFLLRFVYVYFDDLANNETGTMPSRLFEEATGAYTAALVFLLLASFARRFPVRADNWRRRLPLYLLTLVVFSVMHTALMILVRRALSPLLGLGHSSYGNTPLEFLMEFGNQAIFYTSFIVTVQLFDAYREARSRELQTAQLQTELAQAQFQALQSQLQPHFLFNALNTISSVIYEDVKLADTMIARLSEFLRHSLAAPAAQEVSLKEELKFLELYLDIMRPRFEDRLRVDFDIAGGTEDAMVPKLVLQPLVENSIKHAADPQTGSVRIKVTSSRQNGDVRLQVEDDGPGLSSPAAMGREHGLGLSNTKRRLQYLYGDKHEFSMANGRGGGLLVEVRVPYHTGPGGAVSG